MNPISLRKSYICLIRKPQTVQGQQKILHLLNNLIQLCCFISQTRLRTICVEKGSRRWIWRYRQYWCDETRGTWGCSVLQLEFFPLLFQSIISFVAATALLHFFPELTRLVQRLYVNRFNQRRLWVLRATLTILASSKSRLKNFAFPSNGNTLNFAIVFIRRLHNKCSVYFRRYNTDLLTIKRYHGMQISFKFSYTVNPAFSHSDCCVLTEPPLWDRKKAGLKWQNRDLHSCSLAVVMGAYKQKSAVVTEVYSVLWGHQSRTNKNKEAMSCLWAFERYDAKAPS